MINICTHIIDYKRALDHNYSSFVAVANTIVTEVDPLAAATTVIGSFDCCTRCSQMIGCLGSNFNPNDGSCIPTKVNSLLLYVSDCFLY